MTTVFEKIINGELPSEKIHESKNLLVIKDIAPKAPVHLLIITKKVISSLQKMEEADLSVLPEIILVAQKLAKQFNIENNYRLLTNVGEMSGQTVYHLHFHLIGGQILGDMA